MATATTKKKTFNHEETQKRVRHPLQTVRRYIRRYIILEGLALFLLFASLLFWFGVTFDFGLASIDVEYFARSLKEAVPAEEEEEAEWLTSVRDSLTSIHEKSKRIGLHGVDWIQEINEVDTTTVSSRGIRVIVFAVILVGFLALGFIKVVLRWFREFNDRAVALVLERRFHKQLGDRLITAIELADPKLSKKYDYSQAMLEKTIQEAADTLKKLPIASVFNWGRLFRLWLLVGVTTFGFLFVNVAFFWASSAVLAKEPIDPISFGWRFYDVASIWTERNILMQNTYWPRRAHLEIARFQPSREDGKENEMRVAKDDERPELQVRAIEWVIADRNEPSGWRALTWKDLSERGLIEQDLLDGVQVPELFEHWLIDPEELEPHLVTSLFGTEIQERSAAELRAHFAQPSIAKKIEEREEKENLKAWLDWKNWTVDKIFLQLESTKVSTPLRMQRGGKDLENLEAIQERLKELAASPMMSRTLRRLELPGEVEVNFRGGGLEMTERPKRYGGNRFSVPLMALKDAPIFRFRARSEDFYTGVKYISLVPAPQPAEISIDKQEPAYLYHRLHDADQAPLQGLKQETKNFPLSTTGDINTIDLPHGSNLTIHVRTDRNLHPEKGVYPEESGVILDKDFVPYQGGKITIDSDYKGFRLAMTNLTKSQDFAVKFFDEDNIRGKRRFKIKTTTDSGPAVGNLAVTGYIPRKPKFKTVAQPDPKEKKEKDKDKESAAHDAQDHSELMNSFLVTPDARIPFECSVKDDYGLVRVGYQYKLRMVDFELMSGRKSTLLEADKKGRTFRASRIASLLRFRPENPMSAFIAPFEIHDVGQKTLEELRIAYGYRDEFLPAEAFKDLHDRFKGRMLTLDEIKNNLASERKVQAWEFDFKQDLGFDVQKYLRDAGHLTAKDREGNAIQMHYLLQVAVQASDNNVETGGTYLDEKGRTLRGNVKRNVNGHISFVVVTENELLAQIALEEETLSEKLEAARNRLDAHIVSLEEQREKVKDPETSLESLRFRMEEIRTVISTTGQVLKDTELAYDNIRKEMEVNRVRSDRKEKIADNIYWPLKDILELDPQRKTTTGSFPEAEGAFQRAMIAVEDDYTNKRKPLAAVHSPLMTEAEREMRRLSADITRIVNKMSEGITEAKLIAILVEIEAQQRRKSKILEDAYNKAVLDLINKVLENPKDKKDTPDPKKSGSHRRLELPGVSPALGVTPLRLPIPERVALQLTEPTLRRGRPSLALC